MSQCGWIFKRPTLSGDEFWCGLMDEEGFPVTSRHRCEAYVFKSNEGALQTADTHDALRNSADWKVVHR